MRIHRCETCGLIIAPLRNGKQNRRKHCVACSQKKQEDYIRSLRSNLRTAINKNMPQTEQGE